MLFVAKDQMYYMDLKKKNGVKNEVESVNYLFGSWEILLCDTDLCVKRDKLKVLS